MILPPKQILVPLDFSKYSDAALEVAADLAARFGSVLCLLHVVPMLPKLPANVSIFKEGEYERELHRDAEGRLNQLVSMLAQKNVKAEAEVGTANVVATEIMRVAEHRNVDLIVIATHGATGWNRLAFGSVAEKVVHLAPCPVLILRAQHAHKGSGSEESGHSVSAGSSAAR
jgi:nucleotide-binding universal stress UspA family protein